MSYNTLTKFVESEHANLLIYIIPKRSDPLIFRFKTKIQTMLNSSTLS